MRDKCRRRVSRDDAFVVYATLGLYVGADGMCGHAAGEVASREAVDTVIVMVRRERAIAQAVAAGDRAPETLRRLSRTLEAAIQAATYMVFAIAENELSNLDLQVAQANAVSDQLRSKYTNQQLYTWMVGQISALYQQGYQLAYSVAKEAEKACQFELALSTTFINFD